MRPPKVTPAASVELPVPPRIPKGTPMAEAVEQITGQLPWVRDRHVREGWTWCAPCALYAYSGPGMRSCPACGAQLPRLTLVAA